jgi:hypothetical protein
VQLLDVISVLAEHWADTLRYLEPGDAQRIAASIRRIEASQDDGLAAQAAAADLTGLLVARLPSGHPVRDVIAAGPRLVSAPPDWPRIVVALRGLPDLDAGSPDLSRSPGGTPAGPPGGTAAGPAVDTPAGPPGDTGQDADAWVLAAPALTAQQVREHGGDPDDDDLIRLSPADGREQLPAFQFGLDGRPIPVVVTINRLLEAAADPWGVADWWLGRNAWLNGIPADLLGQVDDALLVLAARAEFPEA